ncbi:MAG: UvrD-helicase domain-containing protein [Dehalococcoidia bacterium]|nr:UvrD-helicase domain-containing protein [Dehalococcoidia bacterium]
MTPAPLRHEAISASAGSGKTFQLAHRYIRLIAAGVEPDEIAALTFSRKAAGEIFDSIVQYLCEACGSTAAAAETSHRISTEPVSPEAFVLLLKKLVKGLHRLRIGTLDSFTVGILRSFPFELGIPPGISLMESGGAEATLVQERVLASIYRAGCGTAARPDSLLEAFAQASFGRSEKKVEDNLSNLISGYHTFYRLLPSARSWGTESVIWPNGNAWLDAAEGVSGLTEGLGRLLADNGANDKALRRFGDFADAAQSYTARSAWAEPIRYLFPRLLTAATDLRKGHARIMTDKSTTALDGEAAAIVLALVAHIVRVELKSAIQRTAGAWSLLDRYNTVYEETVRASSTLTFEDAQFLLSGANRSSGGARLSRQPGGEGRLYIDYRLDARLNHWLLDEFQDTSDLQWDVLGNLATEILQDDTGQRSFFFVGDVKQAIYGWRGGNPRLFGMLLDSYGDVIETRTLARSQRSCPSIMGMVNDVFDNLPANKLPDGAIAQWQRFWEPHKSAEAPAKKTGVAMLLEPPCDHGEYKPVQEDRYRVVAELIKEMRPLDRGLSTAILVRSNKDGKAVVDYLRLACPGLPVVHEGRAAIEDNPVVSVMLALARYAAHPGDIFAWRHIQMSPLRIALEKRRVTRESLAPLLLQRIHADGFKGLVEEWGDALQSITPLDAFGLARLRQLITASGEFDSSSSRDCDEFLSFIDKYELHEVAGDGAIRVMTIHQSKGLGFDIVLLPELDDKDITKARDVSALLGRNEDALPEWLLTTPAHGVAEGDPVLANVLAGANAAAAFESLCLLYVAMTRAKRALYVITSYPGKSAAVFNQSTLLKLQLTGEEKPTDATLQHFNGTPVSVLASKGNDTWYTEHELMRAAEASPVMPVPAVSFAERTSSRAQLIAIKPSDNDLFESRASALFSPERSRRLHVGTAVHELLSKVKWIADTNIDEVTQQWKDACAFDNAVAEQAIQHFKKTVLFDAVRNVFTRPHGNVSLRNEWRFDVVVGDRWLTGSFDRVTIVRDETGRPLSARIYDFKTDVLESREEMASLAGHYSRQLRLYRDALSDILSLAPSKVDMVLVFTDGGVVHELRT